MVTKKQEEFIKKLSEVVKQQWFIDKTFASAKLEHEYMKKKSIDQRPTRKQMLEPFTI